MRDGAPPNEERKASGTGALELLLFTPLALFFLFVVIDAGLALVERAAVTSGVRAAFAAEGLERAGKLFRVFDGAGSGELDPGELKSFLRGFLQRLEAQVASSRLSYGRDEPVSIELAIIRLPFNSLTGALRGEGSYEIVDSQGSSYGSGPGEGASFMSRETFFDILLRNESERSPSRFARPLYALAPGGPAGEELFLDDALALYVDVRTQARGLNAGYVKTILGKLYTIQVQDLQELRVQIQN